MQRTLFFPLLARARETARARPLLRGTTAVELVHAIDFDYGRYSASLADRVVVLRTLTFDWWVRQFLAGYPGGTVVELGTGLGTRFERTDNGSVHWIDLEGGAHLPTAGSGPATTPGRWSRWGCGCSTRPRSPARSPASGRSCRAAPGCCYRWPTRFWAGGSPS